MNGVRVDPVNRTARVEGGAQLGDLHHATNAFGLGTPSGIISTTGVGGITLGGGIGPSHPSVRAGHRQSARGRRRAGQRQLRHGQRDGKRRSFLGAARRRWQLRRGDLLPLPVAPDPQPLRRTDTLALDRSAEVLRWYREFITNAPDDLNGFFAFLTVPSVAPSRRSLEREDVWRHLGLHWGQTGGGLRPHPRAVRHRPSARSDRFPPALNSMFDALYPAGDQWYWKADFVKEIPDEAVDIHVQYAEQLPTVKSTMHLYPSDGVAGRVPKDATAWNYRDAKWGMVMVGVSPDPADNPAMIAWTRAYWAALHPYSAGGAYVNMMMDAADEGQDRVRASYGEHYDRLRQIRRSTTRITSSGSIRTSLRRSQPRSTA